MSDSTRKLAYILKSMGFKVHTFHFPPIPIKDAQSLSEWNRQYVACRNAVALHLKRPLTKRSLRKTQGQVMEVKKKIRDFMEASEGILNGTGRIHWDILLRRSQ